MNNELLFESIKRRLGLDEKKLMQMIKRGEILR
jgi:hypothetical protein